SEKRADDPAPEVIGQPDREVPEGETHDHPREHSHGYLRLPCRRLRGRDLGGRLGFWIGATPSFSATSGAGAGAPSGSRARSAAGAGAPSGSDAPSGSRAASEALFALRGASWSFPCARRLVSVEVWRAGAARSTSRSRFICSNSDAEMVSGSGSVRRPGRRGRLTTGSTSPL